MEVVMQHFTIALLLFLAMPAADRAYTQERILPEAVNGCVSEPLPSQTTFGIPDVDCPDGQFVDAGTTEARPFACIEMVTPARNPLTGECREFPTPCDVPEGW